MVQIYGKIFNQGQLSDSHKKIIKLVGSGKSVLELGASTGYLTKRFKENKNEVSIVEYDKDDAKLAAKYALNSYVGSLEDETFLKTIKGKYDVVVAADVLEHLKNPELSLKYLKKLLKKDGVLIISMPNIACWKMRSDLLFKGAFEYSESGILDKTHLRFYTYYTIQKLLNNEGYKISKIYPMESSYPLKHLLLKRGKRAGNIIDSIISLILFKYFPNFSIYHMIFVVTQK